MPTYVIEWSTVSRVHATDRAGNETSMDTNCGSLTNIRATDKDHAVKLLRKAFRRAEIQSITQR